MYYVLMYFLPSQPSNLLKIILDIEFFSEFCSLHKSFSFEDELGIKDEITVQR
jgi:hypothetical protein